MGTLKGFSLRGSVYEKDAVIASRSEEEHWIKEKLEWYRLPTTIIGARQSGKSTLLKKLKQELITEGVPVAYITLEKLKGSSKEDLGKRLWPYIGEQVAAQIPEVEEPHSFRDDAIGDGLCDKLGKVGGRECPVIFFDEFSYVAMNSPWLAQLRGRYESQSLPFKIIFADRSHPKQYPSHGFSPFNITEVVYLRDFSEEVCTSFLQNCANLNGVAVNPQQAAQLYSQHKGQPYLTQVASYRLVYEALQQGRATPSQWDIEKILRSMEQDAESTGLEIYSAFTEYLKAGCSEVIQIDYTAKRVLADILDKKRAIRFDEQGDTGILFTLGFVVPETNTLQWGEWRLGGNTFIRNPLYEKFLQSHRSLLT